MDSRRERGSATIEGAIVFPVVFLVIFSLIGLLLFYYNRFSVYCGAARTLRESGYSWYEGKSLYEDILHDYDDSEASIAKFKAAEQAFSDYLQPAYLDQVSVRFSINNLLLYKALILKSGISEGGFFELEESYPVYQGSIFIRNFEYAREILEDALSFLKEELEDEGQQVYIVDENTDEQEYDRVYHLYQDCSYMRKGYSSSMSLGDGRSLGFRVCRICLARKTGLD